MDISSFLATLNRVCVAVAFVATGLVSPVVEAGEPILPLPTELKVDARKAALGEKLFNDKRLSGNDSIACSGCHMIDKGGADGRQVSVGVGGVKGLVNAPTVFNAALNFRQFWDGRADSLEAQVAGPIHNPIEMGSSWAQVIAKLQADPAMKAAFAEIYKDGIQPNNIQDCVSNYERTLITPNSRFDKYLRGDEKALSAEEKQGYRLFKNYGCIACHQGVNVGGNMYQVFGVMGDYFAKRGNMTDADLGRFNVTKNPADRHVFKVPSLRNVALTAPYFHDGSAKSLEEAVDVMFKYQLGRPAPQQDKEQIVRFLRTLTGEFKGKQLSVQ